MLSKFFTILWIVSISFMISLAMNWYCLKEISNMDSRLSKTILEQKKIKSMIIKNKLSIIKNK